MYKTTGGKMKTEYYSEHGIEITPIESNIPVWAWKINDNEGTLPFYLFVLGILGLIVVS